MFNIGWNNDRSRSNSQSNAYGYSQSGSSSSSLSRGSSQSQSGSQGTSAESVAFEDIFASLYGNAGGAAARVANMAPGFTEQANTLFSGGLNFMDQLGAGDAYAERRLANDNSLVNEQIALLGEDLGAFFRDELNPAISSRAVAGGTYGGGRQGVAQERQAKLVADQFRRGSVELRTADQAQRDAVARDAAANRTAANSAALNAIPGLMEVARGGFGAELAPWEALSSILGGPTTLSSSQQSSFSESSAEEVARAIAESFGLSEDFATSTSSSNSKAKGFRLGIGS